MIKENKKGTPKWVIVLCICVGCLAYLSPWIIITFGVILSNDKLEYNVIGNQVLIEEDRAIISNMKSLCIEEDKTYIIEGYIDNKDLNNIDISFELYDSDGVIINETFTSVYNMEKGKKYKFQAEYYGYDANTINDFKIKEMNEY